MLKIETRKHLVYLRISTQTYVSKFPEFSNLGPKHLGKTVTEEVYWHASF